MNQVIETENAITIEPDGKVEKVIIWLHGLGADGSDFVPVVSELQFPAKHHVRFIFPHADVMPVSINGGMPMRAWYDILQADLTRRVDVTGIMQSVERIAHLLASQADDGIDPVEPIKQDQRSRNDHAKRYGGVGRHVQESAADIEVVVLAGQEKQGGGGVDQHADGRHDHYGSTRRLGRVHQAVDRLPADCANRAHQQQATE